MAVGDSRLTVHRVEAVVVAELDVDRLFKDWH
jgi:hypothetical protein